MTTNKIRLWICCLSLLAGLAWQESDATKNPTCRNTLVAGEPQTREHAKKVLCSCNMPCAKEAGSTDPQETLHDRRCKTYCRADDCKCKPPCM
ncbi:MAG: hypothetical protein DMG08_10355 [Acidobacteria bacterium]|nr:MAG: hypothetical protein DMG08_10355 [Acidobacteriota bacterium]PYV01704.1 MAG: hypothetical protein DMG10_16880 [Acidobacteriota bacterium]